jgi:beta-lactamase regulating signal transducer with metallopeptidase domain
MIAYILKSISCLALLLFFYHIILEKEKMHNFNRFYLLGAILFSFLAPLVTIEIIPEAISETISAIQTFEQPINFDTTAPIFIEETFNYTQLFIGIYCLISLLFFIRFTRNIYKIATKIHVNQKIKHENATLVLVDDKILPHTFWSYIFINKEECFNEKIEEELFTHELTHVTQKHTIDVLIIEILQAVFWINPLFILLKKAVQLNHEFLADETVINQHKNTTQYQHLLLNKAAWNNEYYLASNLNYSITKKRLEMMTTQSSQTKILLKKLAVIPLLTGFIFLFAERVEAQEIIREEHTETIVEKIPSKKEKKTDSEIYAEYARRNHIYTFKDKNGKKIGKKYSELNKEEKKRLIPPPPLKFKKKVPTQELIEKLKDGENYAIWINEKVVKNEVLNNYKSSDFASHFVSFVYKNARSKRFPQNYQAHLSTNKYFKAQNENRIRNFEKFLKEERTVIEVLEKSKDNSASLEKYNYLNDLYEGDRNLKPHYVKSSEIRQKELENLFAKIGGLYFKLSKANKRKTKRPTHPYHPYLKLRKNNKVFYKLRNDLTEEDKLLFPPPPPNPNASKVEILKAKKAYSDWKKRTGNDLSIKEKKDSNKNLSYKKRFSIYLNKENKFDVFGKWVSLENLNKTLKDTHKKVDKNITKAVLVIHTDAKKEISDKAQKILSEYGVLITVVSKYIPWTSEKNK